LDELALARAVVKKVKRVTLLQWQPRYMGYESYIISTTEGPL